MRSQSQKTAVLFFTRSAEAEADYKQFALNGQKAQSVQIATSLIEHIQTQISDTDLPCFRINEQNQIGHSFGERFTNAFRSVFDEGFDRVIAVGNDTPLLESKHITEAAQRLSSGNANIILGPSTDGGTWLMGYNREAFDANEFQQLPWKTSHLLETILEKFGNVNDIGLLETFSDIDDPQSLKAFSQTVHARLSILHLIKRIGSILSTVLCAPRVQKLFLIPTPVFRNVLLRAPPAA